MNVKEINAALLAGRLDHPGLFPHLEALAEQPVHFAFELGLPELPARPGLLIVRGARQYGKSTWLEQQLRHTVDRYGPGSAVYLNGDYLRDHVQLESELVELLSLLSPRAGVRRMFIDEISAVHDWQRALKRLSDAGVLRDLLVVTTGSKATDLRRGSELLPGRRGKLERSTYLFPPISYREFKSHYGRTLGPDCLLAYLLAGGCPVALIEIATRGRLPEFIPTMIRDWIHGECAAAGRHRAPLVAVMAALHRFGGAPLGQAKLAREAGLANNTVAAGYIELLADLMVIGICQAWEPARQVPLARKPAKYHFINLLAAVAWSKERLRSVSDFRALAPEQQGAWLEWLIAQELWRRAAIRGEDHPEQLLHWRSSERELDFVLPPRTYLEVKRGQASLAEFGWFATTLPKAHLTVLSQDRFQAAAVTGATLEAFLLDAPDR